MATVIYSGGGNTFNWADAANWQGGSAPGVSDTALLLGGANSTVTAPVTVNAIMILSGQTVTFDGAVTTYGLGNCKGLMVCAGGTAVFAPGSSLADGGVLQAGVRSTGTFVAMGTAAHATVLTAERTVIGKEAAGIGIMTIDDASLTNTNGLVVGRDGQGTLNIVHGGQVMASDMTVGLDAGSTGQVVLSGASTLTLTGYSAFGGTVGGVAGGTGSVTVGAGALLHGERSVAVASGSTITLTGGTVQTGDTLGGLSVAAGGHVVGQGTVTTRDGGWLNLDGTVEAKGGTLDLHSNVTGNGSLVVGAGATMQIDGAKLVLPKIAFTGASGTLVLAQGAAVTSEIDGFATGDAIKIAGVQGASWNAATDLLTLTGSSGQTVDQLHLGGSFTASQFAVTQQGNLGVITLHA